MIAFAAPAYADQHAVLPDIMMGTWCPIETGSTDNNSIFHYERTNDRSNCSDPVQAPCCGTMLCCEIAELLPGVREGTGTFKFWYLGTPADFRSM